jgi:spore coat polysaccharide biosynthesis predicted glycosyltransferase SpsG
MSDVIVCADAGETVGLGHLMRVLPIAKELQKQGIRTRVRVGGSKRSFESVKDLYDHRMHYVGAKTVSQPNVTNLINKEDTKVAVLDIMHDNSGAYVKEVKKFLKKINKYSKTVFIYGGHLLNVKSDLKVIPYTGAKKVVNAQGSTLCGHKYFVPRKEFLEVRDQDNKSLDSAKKVLISIGGGKSTNIVLKVLDSMKYVKKDLELKVVVGPSSESKDAKTVERRMERNEIKGVVKHGTNKMAKLMSWCDLAVIGDGITKYEAAVTGTPSIVLSRPRSSSALNKEFEKLGSTLFLGNWINVSSQKIGESIRKVLNSKKVRKKMSSRGLNSIDDKGAKRIASEIITLMQK